MGPLIYLIALGILRAIRRCGASQFLAGGTLLSLFALTIGLLYWDPTYDKLWLEPIAVLVIAAAFAYRFGGFSAAARKAMMALTLALTALEAGFNIPVAVRDHFRETAHLAEARQFAGIVTPRDSVVLDFDAVSTLWLGFWGYDEHWLLLPASTQLEETSWLATAESDVVRQGGKLLFVGVLDESPEAWNAFLGSRIGIPYGQFEKYRQRSKVIFRYPDIPLTVREMPLP